MGEPYQHAASNGRRGRHAAPADHPSADGMPTDADVPDAGVFRTHVDGRLNGHGPSGAADPGRANGNPLNGGHVNGHVTLPPHPNGHAPDNGQRPPGLSGPRTDAPPVGHTGNGATLPGTPADWALPLAALPPPPPPVPTPPVLDWSQSPTDAALRPAPVAADQPVERPSGTTSGTAAGAPAAGERGGAEGTPPDGHRTAERPRPAYSLTEIYSLGPDDATDWHGMRDRHAAPEPPDPQRQPPPAPPVPPEPPASAAPQAPAAAPAAEATEPGSRLERSLSGETYVGTHTSPYTPVIGPDTGSQPAAPTGSASTEPAATAPQTSAHPTGPGTAIRPATATGAGAGAGATLGALGSPPAAAAAPPASDPTSVRSTHRASPAAGAAGDADRRLGTLVGAVSELAGGCRALAADVRGATDRPGETSQVRAAAVEVARLLDAAARGADDVLRLLETARDTLAGRVPATSQDTARNPAPTGAAQTVPGAAVPGVPHDTPPIPQPREAPMPSEYPSSTALSYPPVLPLGLRDGAQAAVVARQVEAARRHLMAALTVGHDVGDPAWRQQLLGMIEQVLAAVAEVATVARDALAPSAADTTFPGEARFLCALPWERVPVASPERSESPASVNGVARLLAALGYDTRSTRTEHGILQVEVRGTRYAARVLLQQLRLSGAGEWMAYLDWTDREGQRRSGAETLGPAELSDDELARRVDDALRRRVGSSAG